MASSKTSMNDAEVTRQALGVSFSGWSRLETIARETDSDADILHAYIQLCPFVASTSPAVTASVEALQNFKQKQKTTHHSSSSTTTTTTRPTTQAPTTPVPVDVTHVAMRIAISSFSQQLVQSQTHDDDYQTMRRYIQQCPFIVDLASSAAVAAVLDGLERASIHNPPALVDGVEVESDSGEDSVDGGGEKEEAKAATTSTRTTAGCDYACANNNKEKQTTAVMSISDEKKHRLVVVRPLLRLLRTMFLDLPMAILFASYLLLSWVRRVDQLYIQPSMDAVYWSEERADREITYYHRECDVRDLTTKNADDLLIPNNATVEEAYQHQLLHGFSIFQRVLTDDVMRDLRSYVESRNRNLTAEESIFVIENDNRFSFGLGTEQPCVAKAVKQLATHYKLAPTLEKILGSDPALIEMTAITSTYGAVDQYWHDDVIAPASAMKYGRSFGPSYSVFIQLQNTTKDMGATDACPGSHKCAGGQIEAFCERDGFQAVDSTTGYWKAGDALLMNMNSYHRGTAHVDENAPDRVMLILTFASKPESRAESRQMSQGITFSLRWDMWGHTLSDLAQADTRMTQPWATLRALGLYKPKYAVWGIDYVSGAVMRMSNEDNGFRRDELDLFLERGGIHWLPQFLQGQVTKEENWHEFFVDTLERCLEFLGYVNLFVVFLYTSSLVAVSIAYTHTGFRRSLLRSIVLYGLLYLAWKAANKYVDSSDWAKDINAGRRYTNAFEEELSYGPKLSHVPSTFPHRKDVLIETRYGSRQLHMYNDFTNNHPGSHFFHSLVKEYTYAYSAVNSELFQNATAAYLVEAVEFTQGRFLYQNGNEWLWISPDNAIKYAKSELVAASNPILKAIRQELRFLESDYKYGYLRSTAVARTSIVRLQTLKDLLLRDTPFGTAIFTSVDIVKGGIMPKVALPTQLMRTKLSISASKNRFEHIKRRRRVVNLAGPPKEPRYGAWLRSGDIVEGTELLEDGAAHWYKGTVEKVTASGDYYTKYEDESYGILTSNYIRPYKPYFVSEELEVLLAYDNEDDVVEPCTIVTDHGNGTYDVFLDDAEELVQHVPSSDLRRPRDVDDIEPEEEVRNKYA